MRRRNTFSGHPKMNGPHLSPLPTSKKQGCVRFARSKRSTTQPGSIKCSGTSHSTNSRESTPLPRRLKFVFRGPFFVGYCSDLRPWQKQLAEPIPANACERFQALLDGLPSQFAHSDAIVPCRRFVNRPNAVICRAYKKAGKESGRHLKYRPN